MRSQKRQALARGAFFGGECEQFWGTLLGRSGGEAAWRAGREATLSECITAPLARLSLAAARDTVGGQLQTLAGGKNLAALPDAVPVVGEEPAAFLPGVALAGPAQEQLF